VQPHRVGYRLGAYSEPLPKRDPTTGAVLLTPGGAVDTVGNTQYIGPSAPTHEVGFGNTFTLFRNFRVYALFDYKGGHYLFNVKEWVRSHTVQNTGPLNDPSVDDATKAWLRTRGATAQWIQPADFLKLRDVSLTYQLPAEWTSQIGAGPASVTLAAHNVGIIWKRYGGADPEVNFYGRQAFERADSNTTPRTRRLTAAINVSY